MNTPTKESWQERFDYLAGNLLGQESLLDIEELRKLFSLVAQEEYERGKKAGLVLQRADEEATEQYAIDAIMAERQRIVEILEKLQPGAWFPGGALELKRRIIDEALLAITEPTNGKSN